MIRREVLSLEEAHGFGRLLGSLIAVDPPVLFELMPVLA
jgi:hypothetical protein